MDGVWMKDGVKIPRSLPIQYMISRLPWCVARRLRSGGNECDQTRVDPWAQYDLNQVATDSVRFERVCKAFGRH
jgi:hypothetical protein